MGDWRVRKKLSKVEFFERNPAGKPLKDYAFILFWDKIHE